MLISSTLLSRSPSRCPACAGPPRATARRRIPAARATASRVGDAAHRDAGDGAQRRAVEVASATLGALTARKWRLANGLEVVLLPDPQATSVSYTTWFRVGSRNEDERARRDRASRTCSST